MAISPHPPSFCSFPWYNLTVRIDSPTVNVTTQLLQQSISTQLGVTFNAGQTDVRLQSVKIWGALQSFNASSTLNPINVLILDPIASATGVSTGTGPRVLEQITDYPDQVNRACIGYEYPKAQREFALRCVGTQPGSNLIVANGLGNGAVIYFHLQWRNGLGIPPSLGVVEETYEFLG